MKRGEELAGLIAPHVEPDYTNQAHRIRTLIKLQHENFRRQLAN